MANKNKGICKLCLKRIHVNTKWKILEGNDTQIEEQILEVLFLQVDIKPKERCVICMNCIEMLQKCFEFKSCCLSVQDYITPFIKSGAKIDLGKVMLESINPDNYKDIIIKLCRLCMANIEDDTCKHLDQSEDLVDVIKNCLPELNLTAVYDPLICEKCIKCINEYRNFQKECWHSNNFNEPNECVKLDISNNYQSESIERNNKFDELHEDGCNLEDNGNEEHGQEECKPEIKIEVDEINNPVKIEDMEIEDINIKYEPLEAVRLSPTLHGEMSAHTNKITDESSSDLCDRTVDNKKSSNTFRKKYKFSLETRMFQCTSCPYEAKQEYIISRHIAVHLHPSERKSFKCAECNFTTHWKSYLKKHRCQYKDLSEIQLYKCNGCGFSTEYASRMQRHELKITNSGKIMRQCTFCNFKTHNVKCFKKHKSTKCTGYTKKV